MTVHGYEIGSTFESSFYSISSGVYYEIVEMNKKDRLINEGIVLQFVMENGRQARLYHRVYQLYLPFSSSSSYSYFYSYPYANLSSFYYSFYDYFGEEKQEINKGDDEDDDEDDGEGGEIDISSIRPGGYNSYEFISYSTPFSQCSLNSNRIQEGYFQYHYYYDDYLLNYEGDKESEEGNEISENNLINNSSSLYPLCFLLIFVLFFS